MKKVRSEAPPRLWHYTFSNFNEKVRWTLDHKRIPHLRRNVLPGTPRALWFSRGDGTIPVLDLDGERVVDSTRIIAALERRYPDPPLYPADPEERRRALELEEFFDEQAGHEMRRAFFGALGDQPEYLGAFVTSGRGALARRYMRAGGRIGLAYTRRRYRIYPTEVEESLRRLQVALDRVDSETGPSGYLVGGGFSVADLTAAAVLYPLAWPAELQYDLPKPPPMERLDSLRGHPAVEWIADMYRRHRGVSAEISR